MKQILIYTLLLVVLFTTSSYQSPKIRYIGQYGDGDIFILNADSTFEYEVFLEERYSTGKWTVVDENKIILNSDIQAKIASMDVKVTPSNQEYTTLNVNLNVPDHNNKDYMCTPILNDDVSSSVTSKDPGSFSTTYEMDINSIYFKIEKSPLAKSTRAIIIPPEFYVIYSEPQKIQTKVGDIINVNLTVSDSLFSYRIFTNTELKMKGNTLYFKDTEKGKTFKCKRKY